MNENDQQTPSQEPDATGANAAAATNPQGGDGATDDKVTLSKKDYNNLIAQRDRSNNQYSEMEDNVAGLIKNQAISEFLESHSDKFPDVTKDDLMIATSPDELEALATRTQKRIEEVVQKKLMDVQVTDAPTISPEQAATELKELKDKPQKGGFQRMLQIRSNVK